MKLVVYGLVAVIAVAIAVVVISGWQWNRKTRAMIEELRGSDVPAPAPGPMDSLPEPVARYFGNVFTGEPPTARHLRLTQVGQFRMGEDENSWRAFTATQHVDLGAPGFIWDARIEMAPLVSVRVRDAYIGGEGSMLAKVLAVATVVNEQANQALSSGALLRYLAEAAWFPRALRPSETLRWRAIDDETAAVTLRDAGIEVTATFHFNDAGEITGVSAERYREVDGNYVLTPWRGRFWGYATRGSARIPLEGEVGWLLPEGEQVYWRGEIVEIELDPDSRPTTIHSK